MLYQIWDVQRDANDEPIIDTHSGIQLQTLVHESQLTDPPPDPLQALTDLLRQNPDLLNQLSALAQPNT